MHLTNHARTAAEKKNPNYLFTVPARKALKQLLTAFVACKFVTPTVLQLSRLLTTVLFSTALRCCPTEDSLKLLAHKSSSFLRTCLPGSSASRIRTKFKRPLTRAACLTCKNFHSRTVVQSYCSLFQKKEKKRRGYCRQQIIGIRIQDRKDDTFCAAIPGSSRLSFLHNHTVICEVE